MVLAVARWVQGVGPVLDKVRVLGPRPTPVVLPEVDGVVLPTTRPEGSWAAQLRWWRARHVAQQADNPFAQAVRTLKQPLTEEDHERAQAALRGLDLTTGWGGTELPTSWVDPTIWRAIYRHLPATQRWLDASILGPHVLAHVGAGFYCANLPSYHPITGPAIEPFWALAERLLMLINAYACDGEWGSLAVEAMQLCCLPPGKKLDHTSQPSGAYLLAITVLQGDGMIYERGRLQGRLDWVGMEQDSTLILSGRRRHREFSAYPGASLVRYGERQSHHRRLYLFTYLRPKSRPTTAP